MKGWRVSPMVPMVLLLLAILSCPIAAKPKLLQEMVVARRGRLAPPPPKPNGNLQWRRSIPKPDPEEPSPPPPPPEE
ncbi:hypothetical protein AMTRI_Chr13g117920 [Amborella trichopoda]|uniref:Uncharacterized protein n=1 Tax=Amborella trichopoda TaxID=13333 RepID=W1P4F7_AMBTC|nr:hypothetical protein AMTR_s00213p00017610 [Amborella trichopoda]